MGKKGWSREQELEEAEKVRAPPSHPGPSTIITVTAVLVGAVGLWRAPVFGVLVWLPPGHLSPSFIC